MPLFYFDALEVAAKGRSSRGAIPSFFQGSGAVMVAGTRALSLEGLMMQRLVGRLLIMTFLGVGTGCGGALQNTPLPRIASGQIAQSQSVLRFPPMLVRPDKAQWGLGMQAYVGLEGGSLGDDWSKFLCQVPGRNPSNCPGYTPKLISAKYSVRHSVSNSQVGTASVTESGSAELAREKFLQTETSTGFENFGSGIAAYDQFSSYWQDVVTPTSRSLPKGTLVMISLTVTVTPGTIVACDLPYDSPDFGYSIGARDATAVVYGQCESSGQFVFREGSLSGPIGTQDTQTVSAYIGTPFQMNGGGGTSTGVCLGNTICYGTYTDELTGSAKASLKSLTSGASFKTASGYKYP